VSAERAYHAGAEPAHCSTDVDPERRALHHEGAYRQRIVGEQDIEPGGVWIIGCCGSADGDGRNHYGPPI
jgi:hypothetical protein